MSASFELDARLRGDTFLIGDLGLSRVLLMNDARYPWLILVPRRAGLVELIDLSDEEAQMLMHEIRLASSALVAACPHDKLNIGALGNAVRQLHVHVLARKTGDEAGTGPVWGVGSARAYDTGTKDRLLAALCMALGLQSAP
jgi:diadenosine tetraphosphate (Ap4A) HIT family hydrolase